MTLRGIVREGLVVLENPHALPEGTEVQVRPVAKKRKGKKSGLGRFAGKAKGLPSDAARNLDHYLYGHAKQ
jgi:hypothetical protein